MPARAGTASPISSGHAGIVARRASGRWHRSRPTFSTPARLHSTGSRCGVFTFGSPANPKACTRYWSAITNRMLGPLATAAALGSTAHNTVIVTRTVQGRGCLIGKSEGPGSSPTRGGAWRSSQRIGTGRARRKESPCAWRCVEPLKPELGLAKTPTVVRRLGFLHVLTNP